MKRHATDDVDPVTHTLCGSPIRTQGRHGMRSLATIIDNADPDCKRCLRVIAARLRKEP